MKKVILVFSIALIGIYCFSFVKSETTKKQVRALILLQDSGLSTTLQATLNGADWEITGGDASGYLSTVAYSVFGQSTTGTFQTIKLTFNSTYTKGTLTGIGTDPNGGNVPIGIEYAFISQDGGTLRMGDTEKHSCAGVNCPCCDFIKRDDGTIKGCKCDYQDHDCRFPNGTGSCNHTVTQQ